MLENEVALIVDQVDSSAPSVRLSNILRAVIEPTAADLVPYSPITEQQVATGMALGDICEAAVSMSDYTAGNLVLKQ